jgi:hypothetical protein
MRRHWMEETMRVVFSLCSSHLLFFLPLLVSNHKLYLALVMRCAENLVYGDSNSSCTDLNSKR